MVVFPVLASLCKGLAGSFGGQDMEDQVMEGAPLAMGCPMVGSVEATTRPLLSVARVSLTHSFFLVSLEVTKWTSLCQELVAMSIVYAANWSIIFFG